jgi:hypothetical protein
MIAQGKKFTSHGNGLRDYSSEGIPVVALAGLFCDQSKLVSAV